MKFEDLRLHLSLWRHGSRLRKFFDRKFFDQKKFFFKVSKWFNSQSYQVKIEIWKNIPFSAHYEGILARHLKKSSKSNKLNMSQSQSQQVFCRFSVCLFFCKSIFLSLSALSSLVFIHRGSTLATACWSRSGQNRLELGNFKDTKFNIFFNHGEELVKEHLI